MIVRCAFCGDPVETDHARTFRGVVGWEQPRSQGGANQITLRRPVERWAHWECVDKERRQIAATQGSLL